MRALSHRLTHADQIVEEPIDVGERKLGRGIGPRARGIGVGLEEQPVHPARHRGPHEMPCRATLNKGQEMGWFEHGSTIIVFAPPGFTLAQGIAPGAVVRAGQALMRLPP